MARSTNKQISDRVATLKAMILSGSSNSTAVRFASDEWGLSQRQCHRLLARAWEQIRADVQPLDRKDLVAWAVHTLQETAGDAARRGQPAAVVGAVRELSNLCGLSTTSTPRGWRR